MKLTYIFIFLLRFVGSKADEHRGALILNYPIEHGVVKNWADMEKIWTHIYSKDNLNIRSEDHAVFNKL